MPISHDEKLLKIAVIGAGDMGRRQIKAVRAESSCVLAAVVDPSPDVGEMATGLEAPVFKDLEPMCAEVRPDGVIIATPNHLHVPMALQCIDRGIPALVEKPISDTVDDALALATRSEEAGVPMLVGHHRRHNPIIQAAHKIMREGRLGELTSVNALWLLRKPDGYFSADWRTRPGGGPILINLIHDIDSLRFLVGEITAVQAIVSNTRRGHVVEDSAALLLRFANGAIGTVAVSDATPSPWSWELTAGESTSYVYPQSGEDCYRITGTHGALAIPSMRLWNYPAERSWTLPLEETRCPVPPADPLAHQFRHFADVVRGSTVPLVSARDAAKTLAVTLAVSESARQGCEITI